MSRRETSEREFKFGGDKRRQIVEYLFNAWDGGEESVSTEVMFADLEYDVSSRMRDIFKGHPDWRDLIETTGGACQSQADRRRSRRRKLERLPDLRAEVIRCLQEGWSPEQIAGRLRIEPGAPHRLCHETIYQYVYSVEGQSTYRDDLARRQAEGRLTRLSTATSRGEKPRYVQDALRDEAEQVAEAVRKGARIMVCGGRAMAEGVSRALDDILAPAGLTPAMLKAEGRYFEDVF